MEDTWYVIARESNHYEDHGHLIGYSAEPRSDVIRLYFRQITGTELTYEEAVITLAEVDGYSVGLSRHKDTPHIYLGDD